MKAIFRGPLNPNNFLFTITAPMTMRVERGVSGRTLGLYAMLALMVSLMLIPLACLAHHYFRTEVVPSRPGTESVGGRANMGRSRR